MIIETKNYLDGFTIARFLTRRIRENVLKYVDEVCTRAARDGRFGLLLDCSRLKNPSISSLVSLVELVSRHRHFTVGFIGLSANTGRRVEQSGVLRHLMNFPSATAAIQHPDFRRFAMCKTRAFMFGKDIPEPLSKSLQHSLFASLDVFGRPLLAHQIASLSEWGTKDLILRVSPQNVASIQQALEVCDAQMSVYLDVQPNSNDARKSLSDLASVLASNIDARQRILIHPANTMQRGNIVPLLLRHTDAGSYFSTIAGQACTTDNTTTELRHTKSFDLRNRFGVIEKQALKCIAQGAPIQEWQSQVVAARTPMGIVSDARSFLITLRLASQNVTTRLRPNGQEIEAGVWRAPCASISPKADISGFCFAGSHSVIEKNARLRGLVAIGQHATISSDACVADVVLTANTLIAKGAKRSNGIVGTKTDRARLAPSMPAVVQSSSSKNSEEVITALRGAA